MAQDLFRVEIGLADDNIHYLSGAGAPPGSGLALAAPIGSKWSDTTTGASYTKTGASTWVALATGGDASALQTEVDAIETAVGLNANGTMTWGGTPGNFTGTDTVKEAIHAIDAAVTATEIVASGAAADLAAHVLAQSTLDGNQDIAIAARVLKAGDSMSGNLAFGGTSKVTGLAAPTNAGDATNKAYVDNLVNGLSWLTPVDSVGASTPATAFSGERFLNTTDDKIYTATAVDTWDAGVTPTDGQAVMDRATDAGYVFSGTVWVQFTGAGQITAGVGLVKTGNVIDVNLGAGIAQLPSDEVGLDVRANSGLFLTQDGTTDSTDTAAQLAIKLDGVTLTMGANGLRLSTTLTTAISDNTTAISDEVTRATTAEGVIAGNVAALTTKLNNARTETQVLASTSANMGGVLVDNVEAAKWIVSVRQGALKTIVEVLAIHNGTPSADATQVDYTVYAKLKIGTIAGLTFVVAATGVGAAQAMNLTVSSTAAVDVAAIREVVFF